ncbi:hypothetical protein ES319_A08G078900v1 [Gossypium barbadense]|nr:uncharacterized protein LOC108489949 [Gossypium arboreum]KAB2069159.1 hypothetical protein ES319_A08G078900v1 [Gossypium barbadense]TYH05450.1 hypothetical protein ES288_A08G084300v1 [Gossypium darwinii]
MEITNKVVDVSYFFHLETTGDSEAGYFDPAISVINHDEDDNDDAESCSCDDATTSESDLLHVVNYSLDHKANVGDDHHEDEEEDGEVVDQNGVHLCKKCINGVVVKQNKKASAVSFDSTMNEMEKNKLFWETCLAS